MKAVLVSLAIGLPIGDLVSLFVVGRQIGLGPVLLMLAASAIAGAVLVRVQGPAVWAEFTATLERREAPARQMFDGACVLLGGALFVFPGFVSDVLGLALLTPPVRTMLREWFTVEMSRSLRTAGTMSGAGGSPGPVIDGEWQNVVEEEAEISSVAEPTSGSAAQRPSPWRRQGRVVPSDDP